MESKIEIRHVSLKVDSEFDSFTQALERLLGRFDYSFYNDLETDPRSVEARLKAAAGEQGLMLFSIQEHGRLLNLVGAPRKAKQYLLGNPLIAVTMTCRDIRAALYAPLRILVYQGGDGATRVEFDRPSSLFGQFDNPDVAAVARSLDEKLFNLVAGADRAADPSPARS
ncbi:MAG TPA: DUF302 domain-containing protein [Candidatus Binatia bacterium]